MLSADQVVTQAAIVLRRGKSEAESGIYNYWIRAMLPTAAIGLTDRLTRDPDRRGLVTRLFEITLDANGVGAIDDASFRQLYLPGLQYSSCYDGSLPEYAQGTANRLVYKSDYSVLDNQNVWLDPGFGYYALKDQKIITRAARANAQQASGGIVGPLKLYSPYIPDFSSNYPLRYELLGEILGQFMALAGAGLTPSVQ